MKCSWKKIVGSIAVTALAAFGTLVLVIANPQWLYARETTHGSFRIYSNRPVDRRLLAVLDSAQSLLERSELYDANWPIDLCLNDGSPYTAIVAALRSPGFAWGFYNKVVLNGATDLEHNQALLNGYPWNLMQLIAHEGAHCLQYHRFGLLRTMPLANGPEWKNEGYPEYVARGHRTALLLREDIERLHNAERTDTNGWISLPDSSGTVISYYRNWLLVEYAMTVKGESYRQLLRDTTGATTLQHEMMEWFATR